MGDDRSDADELLTEQLSYYRAIAGEYGDYMATQRGRELIEALDQFAPTGRVLELACGPGLWTTHLLRHATTLAAVDGASASSRSAT